MKISSHSVHLVVVKDKKGKKGFTITWGIKIKGIPFNFLAILIIHQYYGGHQDKKIYEKGFLTQF